MSQDYTVAKELASLKEIKQSAEQRISDLSLNALNYVNDHRLHKADGGGESSDLPYDVIFTSGDDASTMKIIRHPNELSNPNTWNAALYTVSGAKDVYYPCKYINGGLYVFKGQNSSSCRREKYVAGSKSGEVPSSWDDVVIEYVDYEILDGDSHQ